MKEQAKQDVKKLVERFRYNIDVYKKSAYNETQVRREFIDPFFEALGWDVSNKQGYAEQYKVVVHEDTIKVGGSTRAPDYSFRIGGQRKFFVEAKKPAVNIKEDVSPSYQLRRYAWSAKLPLSIVTDFEELSVFDCRLKPSPNDKAGVGRIAYYTFEEYLDKFDAIYDVFSKDAVLKGSFDRYAQSTKGKKGTAEVDSEFLKEIESWRELLAKNIALRNPDVSIYELNYAVQKIIDRIIFLRICEDRAIEPYGQLQTKAESGDVYTHLLNHFKLAESKYDSGIFDFDTDRITPGLSIDDRVLKTIVQSLYYPKSPYEFSVLGVEILGNVYEQFLGKVIRLTAGHQAKVETKPEVKKAGGVYYTPQYIVDYIVRNTVGKLVEGKTPDAIAEIKILDPACGSGSFLIGAYTYLLRYHLDWYTNNKPKRYKEAIVQVRENEWYLTTAEKKRILLNNVFGVDIDPQAVEVTKLSLLLKVLEHESRESIDQQVKLGLEGVLPNLAGNVKCGNSLIGPDFYDAGQQETLFDEAEMRRVNVFDWDDDVKGFGRIMKRGGFDCVIGNPPYIAFQEGSKAIKDYYKRYRSAIGKYDQYILFIEKSLSLLRLSGFFSFIIPNKFIHSDYGKGIKGVILEHQIIEIVDFNDIQIFTGATNYPCILLIRKSTSPNAFEYKTVSNIHVSEILSKSILVDQNALSNSTWLLIDRKEVALLEKLKNDKTALGSLSLTITQGLRTGELKVFFNNIDFEFIKKNNLERELIRSVFHGKNVKRYAHLLDKQRDLILFPYIRDFKTPVDIDKFPNALDYLRQYKNELKERKDSGKIFKNTNKIWFEYWDSKPICFESPKIIFPDISNRNNFYLDLDGIGYLNTCYGIFLRDGLNYQYILGILNSRVIEFFIKKISPFVRGGFYRYKTRYIEQLPIPTIDFSNSAEKAQHDKLVALVDNMLELQKKYHDARMERDKELYERQMKIVDAQVDRLVYDLYGLAEEEVKVVEGE